MIFPDDSLALRRACTASLESWKVLLSETERSKPQPRMGMEDAQGAEYLAFIDIYLKTTYLYHFFKATMAGFLVKWMEINSNLVSR